MSMLNSRLYQFSNIERKNIPHNLLEFLRCLKGLTVFDIDGYDPSRTRVITTLIHGNEPSGFIACHLWLLNGDIPQTNVRIIFCNPEAAKIRPFFTNRYIENSDDLNRFFAETSPPCAVKNRATHVMKLIEQVKPEAIVDVHNTSGSSPAFAVSVSESPAHCQLVSLFTNQLILTELNVGAIMEQSFCAPIITIECGGANDNSSHDIALKGLTKFVGRASLFDTKVPEIKILKHPVRVTMIGDASVGFSNHRLATTSITLRADIEQLNKETTQADEFIGWYDPEQSFPVTAIDKQGNEQILALFELRHGCIFTKQKMHLFMVTTIPEIATKDCLFYVTLA
jgi:succinylglutamate desuccinylase/aspartoacylase family protein